MASKANASENPLDAAMSFVAQRKSAEPMAPLAELPATPKALAPEPVAQVTPTPDTTVEQTADNQQVKGKKTLINSASSVDYAHFFLQPVRGRKPKTIYISEDMHTALATITQACPDGIGLSDLLINIISHHFETFGPGIRQFLTVQEKLRKQKLPY
jgi:hypothetical protein